MLETVKAQALQDMGRQLGGYSGPLSDLLMAIAGADEQGSFHGNDLRPMQKSFAEGPLARSNALARWLRDPANIRASRFPTGAELVKSGALAKSTMDVGFTTNLPQVTGGQAVGVISMDARLARGTIRPSSFTLWNHLAKSQATQVVDYWPFAEAVGGGPAGSAYQSFASQTGTLNYNNGRYNINYLTMKLAVDARAMTLALAQQNSFVNLAEQETANAALNILQSIDWALYYGNPTLFPYQPLGFHNQIPAANVLDFQKYYNTYGTAQGLSNEQALYNALYEQCAAVSGFGVYGKITHAFFSPNVAGSLQSLVTAKLDQFLNASDFSATNRPIVINGDLAGFRGRFGPVAFTLDMMITARDKPVQSIVFNDGTNAATTSNPTPPASVAAAPATAAVAGSAFTSAYAGSYMYAVVSTDASMNESTITTVASGAVINGGDVVLTINPPAANDAACFRVFRSGLGYTGTDPSKFRWIGDVAANGSSAVTFTDANAKIPGSEDIFLFDMDEMDDCIDYRVLLPLSKVELFTSNLSAPWAVAHIGAPRLKIPKFHGLVKNYVPTSTVWNPLAPNA